MACSIDITLQLGDEFAGATLFAMYKTADDSVWTPIDTGFIDLGGGNFLWHDTELPCDFQGAVGFYDVLDPDTIVAVTSINPSDIVNPNPPTVSVSTGHSVQTVEVESTDPTYTGRITIKTGTETLNP